MCILDDVETDRRSENSGQGVSSPAGLAISRGDSDGRAGCHCCRLSSFLVAALRQKQEISTRGVEDRDGRWCKFSLAVGGSPAILGVGFVGSPEPYWIAVLGCRMPRLYTT